MSYRILVVDDSGYSRMLVKRVLENAGYEIIGEAKDGAEALDKIVTLQPDLITLDNILPDMTGLDILRTMKENDLVANVIMISAVGQTSAIEEACELGACQYIIKPFDEQDLLDAVENIKS